mmetsp:Transcript_23469/g.57968  ORF Transcript_23469/g.57968 Transcript_23469/m.57968 type:complete len:150 (-) Transcript_23469:296-745(-)
MTRHSHGTRGTQDLAPQETDALSCLAILTLRTKQTYIIESELARNWGRRETTDAPSTMKARHSPTLRLAVAQLEPVDEAMAAALSHCRWTQVPSGYATKALSRMRRVHNGQDRSPVMVTHLDLSWLHCWCVLRKAMLLRCSSMALERTA